MRISMNMLSDTLQNTASPENPCPPYVLVVEEQTNQKTNKAEPPLNVLILGETANGKSTLIRQLGIYAGDKDPNVKIGYG